MTYIKAFNLRVLILAIFLNLSLYVGAQISIVNINPEILQFINQSYTFFNEDYFGMSVEGNSKHPENFKWYLHQYKKLRFEIDSNEISYIDSLNGIQWEGQIIISCSATRNISWSNDSANSIGQKNWSNWYLLRPIKVSFIKKNGIWARINFESGLGYPNFSPPKDQILLALKRPNIDGVIQN